MLMNKYLIFICDFGLFWIRVFSSLELQPECMLTMTMHTFNKIVCVCVCVLIYFVML